MFAQKKKKSKLWLIILVFFALAAGLWLNSGFDDSDVSRQNGKDDAVLADSDQYEDISDLSSGIQDSSSNKDFSTDSDENIGENGSSDLQGNSDSLYSNGVIDSGSEGDDDASAYYPSSGNTELDHSAASSGQNGNGNSSQYAGKILVIADNDGSIIVYRYDSKGNITSESETDIDLTMLTETDKQLFSKGVTVSDESELSELLQDFEG